MLPRVIVVATDFSTEARRATDYAVELAQKMDARLVVVSAFAVPVLTVPELSPALAGAAEGAADETQRELDELIDGYRDRRVPIEGVVCLGEAVDSVVAVANEQEADLIVIGTHGRKGLSRVVLGSIAERVVRHATCPVLTVH
jgi:nucleotide-binding universal stress UspA family protein